MPDNQTLRPDTSPQTASSSEENALRLQARHTSCLQASAAPVPLSRAAAHRDACPVPRLPVERGHHRIPSRRPSTALLPFHPTAKHQQSAEVIQVARALKAKLLRKKRRRLTLTEFSEASMNLSFLSYCSTANCLDRCRHLQRAYRHGRGEFNYLWRLGKMPILKVTIKLRPAVMLIWSSGEGVVVAM